MNLYSVISESWKTAIKNVRVLSPLLLLLVLPDAARPQVVVESGKPENNQNNRVGLISI